MFTIQLFLNGFLEQTRTLQILKLCSKVYTTYNNFIKF